MLEFACGPGTWTTQLLRHAADLTAVDASSEMIAIASARVGTKRVRFVSADLFERIGWRIKVHPTSGPFFCGTGSRA